jgi:hypothetical protein
VPETPARESSLAVVELHSPGADEVLVAVAVEVAGDDRRTGVHAKRLLQGPEERGGQGRTLSQGDGGQSAHGGQEDGKPHRRGLPARIPAKPMPG